MHFVSTSPVFLSHKDSVKAKFASFAYNPVVTTAIENDVWIGANAIIKSGTTIGNGAVVGAGAVVTKDVAPYSIVAGNPAVHIRFRFPDDIVAKLIESAWWELSDEELRHFASDFNDPEAFIRRKGSGS
jgi:acetyltransferase-like isoleucine patch superfamily enzyme